MGLFRSVANRLLRYSLGGDYLSFLTSGTKTRSGAHVTRDTAIQLALLEACLRVKAETIGSLPVGVHRLSEEDGIAILEPATTRPLHRVLATAPNPEMTSEEFLGRMVIDLELWGNFYALVSRDRAGRIVGLYPVPVNTVEPYWVDEPYTRAYRYAPAQRGEAQEDRKYRILLPGEILHVRNHAMSAVYSEDGLCGTGILNTQRETIGLSIEARNLAADLFANAAMPSALIKVRGSITEAQKKDAREAWSKEYGPDQRGRGRIGFLQADTEFVPVSMKPVDSQFFQNRQLADADIPRITGVPAFLVGLPSNTTYSNTEQQVRAFHTGTIGPLTRRIESALMRDLMGPTERSNHQIRFDLEGLLRGDIATRTKFYGEMIRLGVLNPNEVREMEGKNPREGGDEYAPVPGGTQDAPQPEPEPAALPPAQPAANGLPGFGALQ